MKLYNIFWRSALHYCCQCGHEIPQREKFCPNCGTQIEYLCALPPVQVDPHNRRKVNSAASLTKWIVLYLVVVILSFASSYAYFSSPELQAWFIRSKSIETPVSRSEPVKSVKTASTATSGTALKNAYNQLSILSQKTSSLIDESRKVNIAGDPIRTAVNYRSVQRKSDALLGQLSIPPDTSSEVSSVLVPLKESIMLLAKSSTIMADYLDGKLSLSPPNPDWVARSQEYSAQAQARLKEAQQALTQLRKKIE
jgi:hypothetical protein